MKKTDRCLKKIISVTISMLLVLSSMALGGFQLVVNAQGLSINDLKAKFPQGAYWNHVVTGYDNWGDVLSERWDNSYADTYTWTRCATHDGAPSNGQTDCNAFNGSIQCCGFAKKLASDIYVSNCITWEATWDKSRIKRGDVVHYYGSGANPKWGHWVLIIDVNGDALTVGECNYGDLCKISWGRIIYKSKITFDGGIVDGVRRTGNIYVAPYTAPLDSHKCQYTGKVTKQPTCTENGIKTYTCSCGKSYTEKIPATGHKYVNTFVPPTTSENGYTLHKCSVCGNSYKDNPVTYKDGWYYCDTLPSGITSDKYTIEYNNYYEKTQITSPGSDWKKEKLEYGKWVNSGDQYTTEYPLETSNSRFCVKDVYYHFCIPGSGINSEANYELTSKFTHYDEIPVSEHTIVTWSGDDEGHTVYVLSWDHDHTIYCKSGDTCDGSWGTHDYRSKAWYRKCVYQNRVYQEYYKYTKQSGWISTSDKSAVKVTCRYKPIHLHSYTAKVIAPTCTEKGYTLHTCSNCGDSYKDTYTDKLNHEYGEWTITGDKAVHKCKHCDAEETKPLAASITLDRTSVSIEKGKTLTLKAVVAPDNAYSKSVSWTTTDNSIVTVSDGTVTAKGVGTAAITASTSNGKTATCIVTVTNPTVEVTGISLNKTSASIEKDSSLALTATVSPSDATDKTVTWTTSNSSVATVSNGIVTAIGSGTATITAKTNNGKTATCKVTVTNPTVEVSGISLNKTSASIVKDSSLALTATVSPSDATDKTVTWTTSNSSVATVSNGIVTAIGAGTATITAKTNNGKTATCIVTVTNPTVEVTGISLNKTSATINKGSSITLTATVTPSDATDKTVTWTTSNSSVATVSNGTVTAIGSGTATITAKTSNGKTATCTVTVTNPTVEVTGISLNKTSESIVKGSSLTLTATVTPSDATDKTVTWTTSNSSVATVSNGTVTAKAAGTATITAKTSNGKTATCTVTVTDSSSVIVPTGITLNKTSAALSKGDTINIYATVLPANASDKTVTWSSSNTSVATVSKGNITAKSAGTATITAKTSNGITATCTVTVKGAAISKLNNTSVVNSDIVQVGDKIRVAPSANGGSGEYSSAVYYKRSTASTWKTLGSEFGNTFKVSNSTVAFQPTSEGTFDIKVVIKDTNGAIAEQFFTVDVVKELELTNISVMGRFVVNLGTAIPMIGKAVGGSAPYTYSFYFKRSTNTNWKLLGEKFQTTASARFKPTATGTYDIRIDVKDSNGTIVKKFFTATVK